MRAAVVAICVMVAARASADRAKSDAAASAANAAAAKNDFATAAVKFREAYAEDPRPALMCNVGIAYYKGGNLPRAERYLDECQSIGKALEKAFLDNVAKVYAAVSGKLVAGAFTPVDLTVEPTSASMTVDGGNPFDEPIVGSHRLWFPTGAYKLTIHAEGYSDQQVPLTAKDHVAVSLRITLVRGATSNGSGDAGAGSNAGGAGAGSNTGANGGGSNTGGAGSGSNAGAGGGSNAANAGAGGGSNAGDGSTLTRIKSSSAMPVYVGAIATLGLGLASGSFWFVAKSKADKAATEQDPGIYADQVDSAKSWQHWSWIAAGGSGVAAIVTGVLYWRYRSSAHVEVSASGSGAGVALTGAW